MAGRGITLTYAQAVEAARKRQAATALRNEAAACQRCADERRHGIAHHCAEHYGLAFRVASL